MVFSGICVSQIMDVSAICLEPGVSLALTRPALVADLGRRRIGEPGSSSVAAGAVHCAEYQQQRLASSESFDLPFGLQGFTTSAYFLTTPAKFCSACQFFSRTSSKKLPLKLANGTPMKNGGSA
jgi:hypothetical protein